MEEVYARRLLIATIALIVLLVVLFALLQAVNSPLAGAVLF